MAYRCKFWVYDEKYRECGFVSETQAGMKRHQETHYNAYFPDKAREFEVVASPRHVDTAQASLLEGSA